MGHLAQKKMYYKNDPIRSSLNCVTKKKISRIYNTNNTAPIPDTFLAAGLFNKKDMKPR